MQILQVVGSLTCTFRVGGLNYSNFRILQDSKGKQLVATDEVGCEVGNWVFVASGSAARWACRNPETFTDLTVCGIIDHWPDKD